MAKYNNAITLDTQDRKKNAKSNRWKKLLIIFKFQQYIYAAAWLHKTLALTHWGRVTHICVRKLTIIGSDNGLSPDRRQAIIWTNDGILLIGPLETHFNEILIEIHNVYKTNLENMAEMSLLIQYKIAFTRCRLLVKLPFPYCGCIFRMCGLCSRRSCYFAIATCGCILGSSCSNVICFKPSWLNDLSYTSVM